MKKGENRKGGSGWVEGRQIRVHRGLNSGDEGTVGYEKESNKRNDLGNGRGISERRVTTMVTTMKMTIQVTVMTRFKTASDYEMMN